MEQFVVLWRVEGQCHNIHREPQELEDRRAMSQQAISPLGPPPGQHTGTVPSLVAYCIADQRSDAGPAALPPIHP